MHREEFYQVVQLPTNWAQVNRALRAWEEVHNCYRPHQALGYMTPKSFLQHLKELRLTGGCPTCAEQVLVLDRLPWLR